MEQTSAKARLKNWLGQSPHAAYWVAELHSKLMGLRAWRYRIFYMGRAHIALSAKVTGWAACRIGRNAVVGARTWINVNQRSGTEPVVIIGANAFIGQDNFVTTGNKVVIGPYCLTASHCSFIGSSHVSDDPMRPYATTGTTGDAQILIGANCFFGYGAMVLGNVRIGHGSIIGAGAVVRSDVPAFSQIVGNPARVMRHFDFGRGEWVRGERSPESQAMVPSEADYIRQLKQQHPFLIQPLSAACSLLDDI